MGSEAEYIMALVELSALSLSAMSARRLITRLTVSLVCSRAGTLRLITDVKNQCTTE